MNKDDEEYSINYLSRQAWVRYNPEWLLGKVDENVRDNPEHTPDDPIFGLADVQEAYKAGFIAGATYKLTKELPREGEQIRWK